MNIKVEATKMGKYFKYLPAIVKCQCQEGNSDIEEKFARHLKKALECYDS